MLAQINILNQDKTSSFTNKFMQMVARSQTQSEQTTDVCIQLSKNNCRNWEPKWELF